MLILHSCSPVPKWPKLVSSDFSLPTSFSVSFSPVSITLSSFSTQRKKNPLLVTQANWREEIEAHNLQDVIEDNASVSGKADFSSQTNFRGKDETDYDRDPELAEILGDCFDDPQKGQSRVEERIRNKRSKILHAKTGSAVPMKVTFNKLYIPTGIFESRHKWRGRRLDNLGQTCDYVYQDCNIEKNPRFNFSSSYIWFEFYNTPLPNDVSLICDTIRSWYIIGRLGGCNSMNMQLSQFPMDKRPSYDAILGANVSPTTFYNIGDLELQDNLARVWVDIGTSEPLLLDVLINALAQISSDYVGIKELVFGGSEFENWKENLTSEAAGYSVHKI